jgi:hypothetical protein
MHTPGSPGVAADLDAQTHCSRLCSVHDAMNKDQRKPKRQNAHRDPRQDEKGPNGLERGAVPRSVIVGPVTVRGGREVDRSARR